MVSDVDLHPYVELTLPKANLVVGMLVTVINGGTGPFAGSVTLEINGGATQNIVYGDKKVGTSALYAGSCMTGKIGGGGGKSWYLSN